MAQYDIYPNPGSKKAEIPFLVAIQNDHISSRTGACVVIPLRAHMPPVETLAPLVDVAGHGQFVLSADEIFTMDTTRLKNPLGKLNAVDRAKIRPALDKVIGEY
jgi:mRNA-degrading endonuclease toxin of MazEF toxin-antitoxin module